MNKPEFSLYFNKPFYVMSACRIDERYLYNGQSFFKGLVLTSFGSSVNKEYGGRMSCVVNPVEAARLAEAYDLDLETAYKLLDILEAESENQSSQP